MVDNFPFDKVAEHEFLVQMAEMVTVARDFLRENPQETDCAVVYPSLICFNHKEHEYKLDMRRFCFETEGCYKRANATQMPIFRLMDTVFKISQLYLFDLNANTTSENPEAWPVLHLSRSRPQATKLGPQGAISRCDAWPVVSLPKRPFETGSVRSLRSAMPRIDEKKTATAIAAAQQAALTETLVAPSVYTAPVVPPALPVLSATQAWIFTGEGCALTETLATPSAEAAQTSLRLERGIPDQSLTQTGNPRRFSLTDTMVYHGT